MKFAVIVIICIVGAYLLLPPPRFPSPPSGSLESTEPADTESIYRKAYYTDLSREEIIAHYSRQFAHPLQFRLNLPPEDAYSVIRDQTRSSFLEEIVLPWKASLYINGFTPTLPSDQIERNGKIYATKITVRMIPSHPAARVTVLGMTGVCLYLLHKKHA